ncbi:MAG: alpha-(1-_3)-arabinofuranosyltransferase family protein, partial [Actinomycetes bacterium]
MTIAAVTRKQRPRHQASRRVNLFGWWPWALLGLLSYPQLFASKPGWLAADTKVYLYLDPTKILSSAQSLWNPDLGLGTVTHQNIGYLFPMGPYYWLVHALGIPMWVGQRFWIGSLFFLAGAGILFVGRLLGLGTMGRTTAAIVYMLSPYVIDYIARSSAIVMPWAGLGWMLGFAILAARRGGWRYPALFALVVATVGGVNATSILFVGIAPVLWLFYAAGLREIAWKDVWRVAWRVALLCFFVSLWWASGLWAEGAYGINILLFTESIPTVVATSLSSEVLRGLGYWYFYGADNLEHWTLAAPAYMREAWVLVISFSVPVVAMASGFLARWRYRGYAVLLIVIGVVFSVSAYPITSPTPFGHLLKTAGEQSTAGLAMRSSSRIVPIVVLGLALLLGAGVTALGRWRWWAALVVGAGASVAAILNLAPLFTGHLIAENLKFPNTLPSYTTDAAHFLNSHDTKTRVLGIPGEDFAYYRWGSTMDPIWPGLLDRPYVGRQAVAMGEPSSVNLVRALDESIQDGTFDPKSVAPMARLMSAGDVLLQSDLQNERYGLPRPQAFWLKMDPPPPGLGTPVTFGPPVSTRTQVGTIIDETQLGIPAGSPLAPSIAVFPVASPRPVVRTEPTKAPLIVAGDGEGLLEAGLFGYLDPKRSIFYSASFPSKAALEAVDSPGSTYLITDSNARRLDAWGILHTTFGYVMGTDESPIAYNPNEQAMQVFPEAPASTQTVSTLTGVKGVEATAYGNPVANVPENRPILAYDGDTRTAWEEGSFSNAIGARLQIRLDSPTTTDHVTLLQPVIGPRNRRVTKVTLAFDGARRVTAVLGKDSLHNPGQKITFPSRTFSTLSITIDGETGSSVNFLKYSGIGFAEVTIGDLPKATEALRLPTDLLDKAGTASDNHEVDLLMNRLRANGVPPRSDPEYAMNRVVNLPSARSFEVGGLARISDLIPDPLL